MTSITERLARIRQEIETTARGCGRDPRTIELVAVSKRKPADMVKTAIDAGVSCLGENYIQEAVDKITTIGPTPAHWHFIGHLQSNKARFAVAHFDLIHTVDKLKLARELDKQAAKINKHQKILLQINIGEEATKSGARAQDIIALVREVSTLENLRLVGLMGMPPFFENPEKARPYFKAMTQIRTDIEKEKIANVEMTHLSMGMSNDFKVAIEEGATLVRIGTAIFGRRD